MVETFLRWKGGDPLFSSFFPKYSGSQTVLVQRNRCYSPPLPASPSLTGKVNEGVQGWREPAASICFPPALSLQQGVAHYPGGRPRQALPFRGPPSYSTNTGTPFHGIPWRWSPTPTRCLEEGWFFAVWLPDLLLQLNNISAVAGTGTWKTPGCSRTAAKWSGCWQLDNIIFQSSSLSLNFISEAVSCSEHKKLFPFDDMQSCI